MSNIDLWIRSQDRLSLEKVDLIVVNGSDVFSRGGIIGTYDTCERAMEVLDEINEHIEKQGQTIAMTNEKGIVDGLKYYDKTYVMPEE